jgi:hypothetical protein
MKALWLLPLAMMALRPAAASGSPPTVQYADGRLTADLQDADVVEVVGQLALQAGLEVRGTPTPQRISVRLDAVPLAEAVPRLVQGQSFALTYDRSGALKGIRFLAEGPAAPSPPAAGQPTDAPTAGQTTAAPTGPSESGSLAASDRLFPVSGLLAQALGADQVSFSHIMGVALQSGDARLRKQAQRVALDVVDTDPELRAEVLRTLDGMDDAALADWLTRAAGNNAEEVARRTARSAPLRPLRRRAAAVEELLPGMADPGRGGR